MFCLFKLLNNPRQNSKFWDCAHNIQIIIAGSHEHDLSKNQTKDLSGISHRANLDPKNGLRSSEQAYLFVYQSSIFQLQIETNFEGSFWSNPSDEDFFSIARRRGRKNGWAHQFQTPK